MNMKKTQQVMENNEMMSLWDYLGKPAGPDLGAAVWQAAKYARIKPERREVATKNYKGKVLMYPKSFLDQYFKDAEINNELPF